MDDSSGGFDPTSDNQCVPLECFDRILVLYSSLLYIVDWIVFRVSLNLIRFALLCGPLWVFPTFFFSWKARFQRYCRGSSLRVKVRGKFYSYIFFFQKYTRDPRILHYGKSSAVKKKCVFNRKRKHAHSISRPLPKNAFSRRFMLTRRIFMNDLLSNKRLEFLRWWIVQIKHLKFLCAYTSPSCVGRIFVLCKFHVIYSSASECISFETTCRPFFQESERISSPRVGHITRISFPTADNGVYVLCSTFTLMTALRRDDSSV